MEINHPFSELRDKIVLGTELAFERMIEKAKLNNDELVFSIDGKIVKIRARDYTVEQLKLL